MKASNVLILYMYAGLFFLDPRDTSFGMRLGAGIQLNKSPTTRGMKKTFS